MRSMFLSRLLRLVSPAGVEKPIGERIWKTPIERVFFGVEVEARFRPEHYVTHEFISGLVNQEGQVAKHNGRVVSLLLVGSALSLMFVQGVQLELVLWGIKLEKFPALPQVLTFFLGTGVWVLCSSFLDILMLSRLRSLLVMKALGTDMPNVAIAHLKGSGLWTDLLTPRFIGFSSGRAQEFITTGVMALLLSLPSAILIASLYSLFAIYLFGLNRDGFHFDWQNIIALCGVAAGGGGVIILFLCLFVPLPFIFKKIPGELESSEEADTVS